MNRPSAYLLPLLILTLGTAAGAHGWWLAAMACAGISAILFPAPRTHPTNTPAPAPAPAPAPDGPGLRDTDSRILHARYTDAIAIEQYRQTIEGIDTRSPESAQCLAAAILADREAVMETLLNDRADDEAQINRLAASVATSNTAWRQANSLVRMWDAASGADAPGLKRAATELREILRPTP
ncbi:hypothetical protein [Streptomyces niveus]|uniref:hypothetical protein n=1 Tax=Streptomyces niveus TaxID=193462 RepID=UPI0036C08860